MPAIASFHLVRARRGRAPSALWHLATDRRPLRQVPGLRFWRLLGTGRGQETAPSADLSRTALFAVWEDDAALDSFMASHPIAQRWDHADEAWHVRLRGLGGHGRWRGVDVPELVTPSDPPPTAGPVAIVTRAEVRWQSWRPFRAVGRPVSDEVHAAGGLLAVVAIGEAPVGRQATFSLWQSLEDARRFAYGMPEHREVVRRTRAERWYGEEMFARFAPYASRGSWDGVDPLASLR